MNRYSDLRKEREEGGGGEKQKEIKRRERGVIIIITMILLPGSPQDRLVSLYRPRSVLQSV